MVSPSEGNEARREGHRKSHILIVLLKRGNLYRGDPGEGRRMLVVGPWSGNPLGAPYPAFGSTEWPRIAKRLVNPRRDEPDALIGHVRICGSSRGQPLGRPGPFQLAALAVATAIKSSAMSPTVPRSVSHHLPLPQASPGERTDLFSVEKRCVPFLASSPF